jgi:hypothetical protein
MTVLTNFVHVVGQYVAGQQQSSRTRKGVSANQMEAYRNGSCFVSNVNGLIHLRQNTTEQLGKARPGHKGHAVFKFCVKVYED